MNKDFKENDIVIYCPKDTDGNIYKAQLGKFKRYDDIRSNIAYVWYHSGPTASGTPIKDLYKVEGMEYMKDKFNSLN